jgi:hypothetical protein
VLDDELDDREPCDDVELDDFGAFDDELNDFDAFDDELDGFGAFDNELDDLDTCADDFDGLDGFDDELGGFDDGFDDRDPCDDELDNDDAVRSADDDVELDDRSSLLSLDCCLVGGSRFASDRDLAVNFGADAADERVCCSWSEGPGEN